MECTKRRYSKKEGREVLSNIRKGYGSSNSEKRECRVYRCEFCKFFHLTSRPGRYEKRKSKQGLRIVKPYKRRRFSEAQEEE